MRDASVDLASPAPVAGIHPPLQGGVGFDAIRGDENPPFIKNPLFIGRPVMSSRRTLGSERARSPCAGRSTTRLRIRLLEDHGPAGTVSAAEHVGHVAAASQFDCVSWTRVRSGSSAVKRISTRVADSGGVPM